MRHLLLLAVCVIAVPAVSSGATAHSWYPTECCHNDDCAPVDRVDNSNGNAMVVTTRHGTATVPETLTRRESRDEKMHVCMRPSVFNSQMRVLCIFVPPAI